MTRALAALACLVVLSPPAAAIVGDAAPAPPALARSVVTVVGSRGNFCSGVALARDLVLTAAHCVLPGAEYKIVEYDSSRQPALRDVTRITAHPKFDIKSLLGQRATADVALLKLAAPLASVEPATLGPATFAVAPGDAFVVAGSGVTIRGDGKSGGTVRSAALVATGRPGNLQVRLTDPSVKREQPGLGACTGDSGGPVFQMMGTKPLVIGLVSWSTGPGNSAGCGGLTGVTPLVLYRDWIVRTAQSLGHAIGP